MTGVGGHKKVSTSQWLTQAVEIPVRGGIGISGQAPFPPSWPEFIGGPDNAEETCYAALLRMLRGH